MKYEFTKKRTDYILNFAGLTDTEKDIFLLRCQGLKLQAIALRTFISMSTLTRSLRSIEKKIEALNFEDF